VVLQWCYSGVTVVLPSCYSRVTVALQSCYSGVIVLLQWCHRRIVEPSGKGVGSPVCVTSSNTTFCVCNIMSWSYTVELIKNAYFRWW
jgi:hypothetical protein